MVIIGSKLDFKLYKNNIIKIEKNSIDYSKKNDKILFELDEDTFEIKIEDYQFEFQKENKDNIFKVSNDKASIYLKEHDLLLPITVEDFYIHKDENKYIIKYQLETDDEQTTIEIIL